MARGSSREIAQSRRIRKLDKYAVQPIAKMRFSRPPSAGSQRSRIETRAAVLLLYSAVNAKIGGPSIGNYAEGLASSLLFFVALYTTTVTTLSSLQPIHHKHPMLQKLNKNRGGFTLVEIMIVVAIIALLAAIAVPNFLRARKRSQATRILEDLRIIDSAHRPVRDRNQQVHRRHRRLDRHPELPQDRFGPLQFRRHRHARQCLQQRHGFSVDNIPKLS